MQGFFKTTKCKLPHMPIGIPKSKSYENIESDLSSYCDDFDWIHNFNLDIDLNLDEILITTTRSIMKTLLILKILASLLKISNKRATGIYQCILYYNNHAVMDQAWNEVQD